MKKKNLRIEILIAIGVLLILSTLMVPRFLGAQRKARAAQLQAFIDAVMNILVENDETKYQLMAHVEKGLASNQFIGKTPYGYGYGLTDPTGNKISGITFYYFLTQKTLTDFFPDHSLPYISKDLHFGEPTFYLLLSYRGDFEQKQLTAFGLYSELYDREVQTVDPEKGIYHPTLNFFINQDHFFEPYLSDIRHFLYQPSNGVESGGIVYRGSFEAGWRVKAVTEPIKEESIQKNPLIP